MLQENCNELVITLRKTQTVRYWIIIRMDNGHVREQEIAVGGMSTESEASKGDCSWNSLATMTPEY